MFASATFKAPATKAAVLVPSEAVISTGQRNVVIIDRGNGKFAPVDVEVGRGSGDLIEIVKGVAAGDRVVTSSQFLIDSEASLRGVLKRMEEGEASAASHEGHSTGASVGAAAGAVSHVGSGVVRNVDPSALMIQHGAIPSAGMGAMTMEYKAPKSGVPKELKEGMRVDFEFVLTPKGEYELTRISAATSAAKGTKP
jgi:Cu(I)/Ag(I) efflux system membrane fusion protein